MSIRSLLALSAALAFVGVGLTAQPKYFPVDDLRPGMTGVGRTVFEGDRLEDFQVHILGVLRNVIGPQRNLVLARLEGGPLAKTGVIAGMSGSPVYIDGRLLGAVSYAMGQFSTEPIAGITPIGEMIEAAATATATPARARPTARLAPARLLTPEALLTALRRTMTTASTFAATPADIQVLGGASLDASLGARLRPIATPLTVGGFDNSVFEPVASVFRSGGFVPVVGRPVTSGAAGANGGSLRPIASAQGSARAADDNAPVRPGDAIGVTLMSGDFEIGATGTITEVDGTRLYAFGHPFYGLGPTQFPMTRSYVFAVLPSLQNSTKIASTGPVIGTIQQDRAVGIAGTLGPGPALIPITLTLTSDSGTNRTFRMSVVKDQMFTPLLTYLSVSNTLTAYERQNGAASYMVRGSATTKKYGAVSFEDLFSGDQPLAAAATSVIPPITTLVQNAFEDVDVEGITIEIDASEQPRSASLERAWVDNARVKPGSTVDVNVALRTYRGEQVTRSVPVQIPPNARGSVSIMVTDAARLSEWEARELQAQPLQSRDLPQMIRALNSARKNNRLYVRLVTSDDGAVVKGESLAALPPSVLAVMQADRDGGSFRPLQSALLGNWEIAADYAVTGFKTLTLPLEP